MARVQKRMKIGGKEKRYNRTTRAKGMINKGRPDDRVAWSMKNVARHNQFFDKLHRGHVKIQHKEGVWASVTLSIRFLTVAGSCPTNSTFAPVLQTDQP